MSVARFRCIFASSTSVRNTRTSLSMRRRRMATGCRQGLLPALVLLLASAAAVAADDDKARCEAVESIGVASMAPDGVITLRIRSLPPGPIAEGQFRYAPNDPKYEEIKKHLGGIAPGESKPVRPWC
jgi:hypothetical protein